VRARIGTKCTSSSDTFGGGDVGFAGFRSNAVSFVDFCRWRPDWSRIDFEQVCQRVRLVICGLLAVPPVMSGARSFVDSRQSPRQSCQWRAGLTWFGWAIGLLLALFAPHRPHVHSRQFSWLLLVWGVCTREFSARKSNCDANEPTVLHTRALCTHRSQSVDTVDSAN
jgi:hypothetical protein